MSAPEVAGTARTGAKVAATTGSWPATPLSYTYQWYTNGKVISGATK